MRNDPTFGQRAADKIAAFGGSWTFLFFFSGFMFGWIWLNTHILLHPFDPPPHIMLNLVLSCLAAVQAPILMIAQNRQAKLDRAQLARIEERLKHLVKLVENRGKVDNRGKKS